MKGQSMLSVLVIFLGASCVDRIFFDIGKDPSLAIVVQGHISDQPGPYRIELFSAFDLESKLERHAVSAKRVELFDDQGNREELIDADKGVYMTAADGIRGIGGRVYTLRIELYDGRIYESIPDTLPVVTGKLDSLYYTFEKKGISEIGVENYAFDILFDASSNRKGNFLWKFTGTFKVDTNPEILDIHNMSCGGAIDCPGCNICNFVPRCSGMRNVATSSLPDDAIFKRFKPCECCTCWYNLFNEQPILSDNKFLRTERLSAIKAGSIPVHPWIFQHKVYAEVTQMSLSYQSYVFWKAIRAQKEATNSLFQPITGRIPSNFIQTLGRKIPIEGIFFATSLNRKTIIISRKDVPGRTFIFPPSPEPPIAKSCLELFPNSTNVKPLFWQD